MSKGGAFIHDPKLANEPEIKAKVKLQFRDRAGNKTVVSRIMQATQKVMRCSRHIGRRGGGGGIKDRSGGKGKDVEGEGLLYGRSEMTTTPTLYMFASFAQSFAM